LKVLFEFVRLKPQEILELGRDVVAPNNRQPTDAEITEIAKKKKERDVLLQSASTELTTKFRDWWKQGEYRFRFQADGDHFRIWVSDDLRPEDIELEGRSTGLQWFLSFYLIFLVESQDAHQGAILLLDEPGLSLHPLAQRDLSEFFDSLSQNNQILYTTHSPFLVDPNHLDRVKAVYVHDDGTTGVSSDLRAGEKEPAQTKSIYPVHAALGLSVSDILLTGAQSVIVEGISDQFYLSAAKILLISAGRLMPSRELVFVPAGGVRGVKAVAGVLAGKDEQLPVVLLDGDTAGQKMATDLRNSLYAASKHRVLELNAIADVTTAEIEDVMPRDVMVQVLDRYLRGPDDDFSESHDASKALIPQVEDYAKRHNIVLTGGWKVEVARLVKSRLLKGGAQKLEDAVLDRWTKLFNALTAAAQDAQE
jgi:predicted ATP-dependent endonuclease of OLD family